MNRTDITAALQAVREARHKRNQIDAKFHSDVDYVMHRLILEASANMMSAEEVAEIVGYTPMRIRDLQRIHGLSPSKGRGLMAKQAAEALADNAAIMGIEPHEVDLTSPLAYLPMGSELREKFRKKFLETTVSQVKELPDEIDCPACGQTFPTEYAVEPPPVGSAELHPHDCGCTRCLLGETKRAL